MSKHWYLRRVALASVVVIAGCSSDTPTRPPTTSLRLTAAAPAIGLSRITPLCYPGGGSTRVCRPRGLLSVTNTGGGTLTWTATQRSLLGIG
jgi:hypothetical protein